jgi:hypothetical protein
MTWTTLLNLQAANTMINVDLPWNPAVLEQRIWPRAPHGSEAKGPSLGGSLGFSASRRVGIRGTNEDNCV